MSGDIQRERERESERQRERQREVEPVKMKDDVGECVSVWLRQFTDGLVQFTAALQLIMSLCTVHTLQCTHTVHAVHSTCSLQYC